MKNIVILFKSGKEVTIRCREFFILHDLSGNVVDFDATGMMGNNILYADFTEVACIYERKEND
jgi:hypothetical protein